MVVTNGEAGALGATDDARAEALVTTTPAAKREPCTSIGIIGHSGHAYRRYPLGSAPRFAALLPGTALVPFSGVWLLVRANVVRHLPMFARSPSCHRPGSGYRIRALPSGAILTMALAVRGSQPGPFNSNDSVATVPAVSIRSP